MGISSFLWYNLYLYYVDCRRLFIYNIDTQHRYTHRYLHTYIYTYIYIYIYIYIHTQYTDTITYIYIYIYICIYHYIPIIIRYLPWNGPRLEPFFEPVTSSLSYLVVCKATKATVEPGWVEKKRLILRIGYGIYTYYVPLYIHVYIYIYIYIYISVCVFMEYIILYLNWPVLNWFYMGIYHTLFSHKEKHPADWSCSILYSVLLAGLLEVICRETEIHQPIHCSQKYRLIDSLWELTGWHVESVNGESSTASWVVLPMLGPLQWPAWCAMIRLGLWWFGPSQKPGNTSQEPMLLFVMYSLKCSPPKKNGTYLWNSLDFHENRWSQCTLRSYSVRVINRIRPFVDAWNGRKRCWSTPPWIGRRRIWSSWMKLESIWSALSRQWVVGMFFSLVLIVGNEGMIHKNHEW